MLWKAVLLEIRGRVGAWTLDHLMNASESGGKTPLWALDNTKVNGVREILRVRVMGETQKVKISPWVSGHQEVGRLRGLFVVSNSKQYSECWMVAVARIIQIEQSGLGTKSDESLPGCLE